MAFKDISFQQDEEEPEERIDSESMTWQDRVALLDKTPSVRLEEELEDMVLDDISPEDAIDGVPESQVPAYLKLVFGTEAYEWLTTRLRREFRLVPTDPDTIGTIRDEIVRSLPSAPRISRKASSQTFSARFELDWDIFGFFDSQEYSAQPDEILEGVITLTGSCQDAQATTCAQYMHQTWPSTGEVMMQLIKEALRSADGSLHLRKCLV
jgi:hypothetical protein